MSGVEVTGGSAGIGQKEITPNMIDAVFENLELDAPKHRYNVHVGTTDDVTFNLFRYYSFFFNLFRHFIFPL